MQNVTKCNITKCEKVCEKYMELRFCYEIELVALLWLKMVLELLSTYISSVYLKENKRKMDKRKIKNHTQIIFMLPIRLSDYRAVGLKSCCQTSDRII